MSAGKPGISELQHWSDPVTTLSEDWALQCVPYFQEVVRFAGGYTRDPLARTHWEQAHEILDIMPEPATVTEANLRWRKWVVAIWTMVLKARERNLVAQAAAQARRIGF